MALGTAVASLNQMVSDTRTSPRKRASASAIEETPQGKGLINTPAQGSRPRGRPSKSLDISVERPRKSITQLPTPRTSTVAYNAPQPLEITVHPPDSPEETARQEEEPVKKKRKFTAKDKPRKSSPFKKHAIVGRASIAGPNLNFTSNNSPAKIDRRRRNAKEAINVSVNIPPNRLSILNTHPIQITSTTAQTENEIPNSAPQVNGKSGTTDTEEAQIEHVGEQEVDEVDEDMGAEGQGEAGEVRREPAASGTRQNVRGRAAGTVEEQQRREENRKAQKEAEERRKNETFTESTEALVEEFDKFKEEFGRGLGRAVGEAGGIDTWEVMGAGALTIMGTAPKKDKMDNLRAQSVWRKLEFLDNAFAQLEKNGDYTLQNEEAVQDALRDLKARSTLNHLRPTSEQGQRGLKTVVELYQQMIPKVVFLLKKVLLGRYVDGLSTRGVRDVLKLAETGMELCKIAMEWEPKPSVLESGTRRAVLNHINPSLRTIRNCLAERAQHDDYLAEQQQRGMKLAHAQKQNRERKLKLWEERQRRFTSHHANLENDHARPATDEPYVVDIDDIEDERSHSILPTERRPNLPRQVTEEIPAPDPSIQWTREEDVALLDGLQQHRDGDRFERILDMHLQLSEKDIFQLMARAQFHKHNNTNAIIAAEERGESCFDWLSSV